MPSNPRIIIAAILFVLALAAPFLVQQSALAQPSWSIAQDFVGGCWQPVINSWTQLCATPITNAGTCGSSGTANGTCIYYVSDSLGNDSNSPCTNINAPCQHIIAGASQMRNGKPDWLLLKQNDTFTDQQIQTFANSNGCCFISFGQSATAPQLVSSYDPSQPGVADPAINGNSRPLVKTATTATAVFCSTNQNWVPCDYTAIVGIHLYAYTRDPAFSSPNTADAEGISYVVGTGLTPTSAIIHWMLIEDCYIQFYTDNINGSAFGGFPNQLTNITYNRNVISDAYTTLAHAGTGILQTSGGTTNLNVWQNYLIHNGYSSLGAAAGTHHQMYFGDCGTEGYPATCGNNVNFFQNVVGDGASTEQLRAGGTSRDNLWVHQTETWAFAAAQNFAYAQTNDVLDEFYSSSVSTLEGVSVLPQYQSDNLAVGSIAVTGNLFSNALSTDGNQVFNSTPGGGSNIGGISGMAGTLGGNVVYNWRASSVGLQSYSGAIHAIRSITGGATTDRTVSITSAGAFSQNATQNVVQLNMASNANMDLIGFVWITGGGSAGVPDGLYREQIPNSSTTAIILPEVQCNNGTLGSCNFTGTIFYPWHQVPFTGGTGSGAKLDVISVGSTIKAINLYGQEGTVTAGIQLPSSPGTGFTAGDSLQPAASCTTSCGFDNFVCNSCGFSFVVDSVVGMADLGTNYQDLTASNPAHFTGSGGDPTRTVSTYDSIILGGPGTYTDYFTKARAQAKNNWNTNLTACAVNNWIRAGFLMSTTCH